VPAELTIAQRSQPPCRTSAHPRTHFSPARKQSLASPSAGLRRSLSGINQPKSLTKTSQLSLAKRKWSRPLLTGTAPQTEFSATYSKQTMEKFLTGARTHIRIFQICQLRTQNLAQLIQRPFRKKFGKRDNCPKGDGR